MVKVVVGVENTCTIYRDTEPPEGVAYMEIAEVPVAGGRILYDPNKKNLYAEPEPTPLPPSDLELTQQDITDLQLADIERGQEITDLQIAMMEVSK